MDMNVWIEFIKQNWLVILIALVVLLVVLNVVKTVLKWLIVIVIVAGLLIYSGISMDQIQEAVISVKDEAVETMKSEAVKVMAQEAKEAKYTSNGDGGFTITSPNLEVTGTAGSDKVKVSFKGVPLGEWSVSDTVATFIDQAKSSSP